METVLTIDENIFVWVNSWVGVSPFFDGVAEILVGDYLILVFLSLVLVGLWFSGKTSTQRDKNQRSAIRGMLGLAFANLAVLIVNQFIFRPRPFTDYEISLLFYQPTDSSFPANPVAVAFAIATAVAWGHKRLGIILYVIATTFGVVRIYAGVCYPLDAIAGASIGVVVVVTSTYLLKIMEPIQVWLLKCFRFVHAA